MYFLLTIALLAVSIHASAQDSAPKLLDLPLEDLLEIKIEDVYGASKRAQKITEAPASITVIDQATIRRHGYTTLAQVLDGVRGHFTRNDRVYQYLGTRGVNRPGDYNSRTLLLINGHRINDNIYQQAAIGTEFILDLDLVEKIEIVRGPSSSLYGSGAFFGVINVITRDVSKMAGLEASLRYGSFDQKTGRATYGRKVSDDLKMLFSATHSDTVGRDFYYPEYADVNDGNYENTDGDRHHSALAQLVWRSFTFEGAMVSRKKEIPTASFFTLFNDPRGFGEDERAYFKIRGDFRPKKNWEIQTTAAVDEYKYDSLYIDPFSGIDPTIHVIDRADNVWYTLDAQATRRFETGSVIFGGEVYKNDHLSQENALINPHTVFFSSHQKSDMWSAFVQVDQKPSADFSWSLGGRYDHFEDFDGAVSPRLAMVYTPASSTIYKLIAGSAFRAPNAYELYYDEGGGHKRNPDLGAERIYSVDLVWENYYGDHWRSSVTGFVYRLEDMIGEETDPNDGLTFFDNLEEARGTGVELELEGILTNGLRSLTSYSYAEVEDRETGRRLSQSPRHLAKTRISSPILRGHVEVGVEMQYVSEQISQDPTLGKNSGYFLTNISLLAKEVTRGLSLSGAVYNLFDRRYGHLAGSEHLQKAIPQDGATYHVQATYRF